MEKQNGSPSGILSNFEKLEKKDEVFLSKLFEILLEKGKLGSSTNLEIAREVNQAAGQNLSDATQLVSVSLPRKEIKEIRGVGTRFRSNYNGTLNALVRSSRFKTIGDIRNTDPIILARVNSMSIPRAEFIKTVFASPQTAESK